MNFNYITFALLLILCGICSYTDLKNGLVRNSYLLLLGSPALAWNLYCLFRYREIPFKVYLLNLLVCAGIALSLYAMKIWAGGDCKLFLVIALAMPGRIIAESFYRVSLAVWIPFLAFMISYLYIVLDSFIMWSRDKQRNGDFLKKIIPSFAEYIKSYLAIVFIDYFALRVLDHILGSYDYFWLLIMVNVLLLLLLRKLKLLQYKSVIGVLFLADLLLGICAGARLIDRQILITWQIILLSTTLRLFVEEYNYKEIPIKELQAGMILSSASSLVISNSLGPKGMEMNLLSDESLGSRLSQEEVDLIHQWALKKKQITSVSVVRKVPFATFISLSVLIVFLVSMAL